jgi:hypothetical protein
MLEQLVGEPGPKRDRPHRPLRFRRLLLAIDDRFPDFQAGAFRVGEEDVLPAEAEDLAATKARVQHGQEDDTCLLEPGPLDAVRLVRELCERAFDAAGLGRRQDRPATPGLPRPLNKCHRACRDEASPKRRLEQRRKDVQMPVHRPLLESRAELGGDVPLERVDVDGSQFERAEGRRQMPLDDRPIAVRRRPLQSASLGMLVDPALRERREGQRRWAPVALPLAQLGLSLPLRPALGLAAERLPPAGRTRPGT